jgi:hypothetical protein
MYHEALMCTFLIDTAVAADSCDRAAGVLSTRD